MWKYPDGTYKITPPARVELAGYIYPFTSLSAEQLDSASYNEVIMLKKDPFYTYTTEWVKDPDFIYREVELTKTPNIEAMKADKLAKIQAGKSTARDAGIMVNGMLFDTDSSARIAYLELSFKLSQDPTYSVQWKANDDGDWVEMNSALFNDLYVAFGTHLEAVFAWQEVQSQAVAAASTPEEIAAISDVYGS